VLVHVSETGEKVYTVRAASGRLLSVDKIRMYCDLADKYCDGYLRFTSRHSVEFMTPKQENVDPLIKDLRAIGHPVGGIGNAISSIVHTQGWIHCHSAATDASGVVKCVMDDLIEHFENTRLPGKLRHRHPGDPPASAADRPLQGRQDVRDPERLGLLSDRGHQARHGGRFSVRRGDRRALHVLRQLLHGLPVHAVG
jgi:hypothetical protein